MKWALSSVAAMMGVAGLAASATAGLQLSLLKTINLSGAVDPASPSRLGTNINAVAWTGGQLYVGGWNGSGAALSVGFSEILTPLTTPTQGARLGTLTAPSGRGYTGMATQGGVLAASADTGAAIAGGYSAWNTATNTNRFNATLRGFTGPAFDPGFAGSAPSAGNIAYSSTGSGRRGVLNNADGSIIYSLGGANAGLIWNNIAPPTGPGSNNRDLAFDPATGDVYGRAGNAIIKAPRTGENSAGAQSLIFVNYGSGGQVVASNTNSQNLAFMNRLGGNVILFNDRPAGATTGSITGTVKAIDTAGVVQTINWGGFDISSGTGAFDFSYDAATDTVAVADYSNSNVYIFAVPAPAGAAVLALGGLMAARRRRA